MVLDIEATRSKHIHDVLYICVFLQQHQEMIYYYFDLDVNQAGWSIILEGNMLSRLSLQHYNRCTYLTLECYGHPPYLNKN